MSPRDPRGSLRISCVGRTVALSVELEHEVLDVELDHEVLDAES